MRNAVSAGEPSYRRALSISLHIHRCEQCLNTKTGIEREIAKARERGTRAGVQRRLWVACKERILLLAESAAHGCRIVSGLQGQVSPSIHVRHTLSIVVE